MKLYQVLVLSKAADDHESFRPYESLIFGSVEEAKRFMATKESGDRAIVWNNTMTGGEGVVAYGQTHPESEWFGFHYHIQALSIWSDSVVVVPIEKIRAMREIIDRMESRLIAHGDIEAAVNWLEGYPGQTAQQIADHKMDGDL